MNDKPETFMEHMWANLAPLMLFALFIVCMGSAMWIALHGGMDEGTLDWARGNTGNVLSGLLGALGAGGAGYAAGIRKGTALSNPAPPDNSTITKTSSETTTTGTAGDPKAQ